MNALRDSLDRKRQEVRKQHKDQLRAILISKIGRKDEKVKLPKELKRYKNARIFKEDARRLFKPETIIGPVMIGLEDCLLDDDEIAVLCKGPKFCIWRILSKERYLVEAEKCFCKLRFELFDDDDTDKKEGGEAEKETAEERKERERLERLVEVAEIESKTVFNEDEETLDYGRKRATDCKHNT